MRYRSVFSFFLAAAAGFSQTAEESKVLLPSLRFFQLDGAKWLAPAQLGTTDWRTWVDENPAKASLRRGRRSPGATVEVVERLIDIHRDRVLELNAEVAPVLISSFIVGERSSTSAQMLSEFMSMHGSSFYPPTLPSVWYNGTLPYWVQQGWESPYVASSGNRTSSGLNVTVAAEPRHVMLYPGRR